MSWIKTSLYWADIALLWLLDKYSQDTGTAPSHRELDTLWNSTMVSLGAFNEGYAQPITSSQRLETTIKALRRLELLAPTGKYNLTNEGRLFLLDLNSDWKRWPVMIPIKGNKLLIKEASYMEDN